MAAALRAAHTRGLNTDSLTRHLATIAASNHGTDAATSAARATEAIRAWTATQTTSRGQQARRLIGGIVPDAAHGITNNQVLTALRERATLIESRVGTLADQALDTRPPWMTGRLAGLPDDPTARARGMTAVRQVVAYRDRWGIAADHPEPLGPRLTQAAGMSQRVDHRHATAALGDLADIVIHHESALVTEPMVDHGTAL